MADIDVRRAHGLGLKAARAAAERMAESLGRKFDLKGDWNGNTLNFARSGVSGSLEVGEKDVRLSVTLGFLLKAMKGSIERAVHGELDALFAAKAEPKKKPEAAPREKAAEATPKKASAKKKGR
jgi:putative polyhydroxyalkanoate system protein